jgi:hypothetical protein
MFSSHIPFIRIEVPSVLWGFSSRCGWSVQPHDTSLRGWLTSETVARDCEGHFCTICLGGIVVGDLTEGLNNATLSLDLVQTSVLDMLTMLASTSFRSCTLRESIHHHIRIIIIIIMDIDKV